MSNSCVTSVTSCRLRTWHFDILYRGSTILRLKTSTICLGIYVTCTNRPLVSGEGPKMQLLCQLKGVQWSWWFVVLVFILGP